MKRIVSVYIHLFIPKGKQRDIYAIFLPLFIFFNLHLSLSQGGIRAPLFDQRSLPSFTTVDSTRLEFFPLKIGNMWQGNIFMSGFSQLKIINDTVINGKKYYFGIGGAGGYSWRNQFVRIDSLFRVQFYSMDSCGYNPYEHFIYDLGRIAGEIYPVCEADVGKPAEAKWVVKFSGIFTSFIFGEVRDIMEFKIGWMNVKDSSMLFSFNYYLARGIGVISEEYEVINYQCTGAIIDGNTYGNIVNVKGDNLESPILYFLQNYPNPCSSFSQLTFSISNSTYVNLILVDILGRHVATLLSEYINFGTYKVSFNVRLLDNGIYFYRLIVM